MRYSMPQSQLTVAAVRIPLLHLITTTPPNNAFSVATLQNAPDFLQRWDSLTRLRFLVECEMARFVFDSFFSEHPDDKQLWIGGQCQNGSHYGIATRSQKNNGEYLLDPNFHQSNDYKAAQKTYFAMLEALGKKAVDKNNNDHLLENTADHAEMLQIQGLESPIWEYMTALHAHPTLYHYLLTSLKLIKIFH